MHVKIFILKDPCPIGFVPDSSGEICYNFLTNTTTANYSQAMCQQLYNGATLPVFRSGFEYQNFINHTKYIYNNSSLGLNPTRFKNCLL